MLRPLAKLQELALLGCTPLVDLWTDAFVVPAEIPAVANSLTALTMRLDTDTMLQSHFPNLEYLNLQAASFPTLHRAHLAHNPRLAAFQLSSPTLRRIEAGALSALTLPNLRGLCFRETGKEAAEDVDRVVFGEDVQDLQAQTFREAVC